MMFASEKGVAAASVLRRGVFGTVDALNVLGVYVAAGITAFGWGLCKLLELPCAKFLPIWFVGAVFTYNLDRLSSDTSDHLNLPRRTGKHRRLRRYSVVLAAFAGLLVLAIPLWQRDWLLLGLAVCAAAVCSSYSIRLLGFRIKSIGAVKTLFAPVVIVLTVCVVPWIWAHPKPHPLLLVPGITWAVCALLINALICDLRDEAGDRAAGRTTLPISLGTARTNTLLIVLLAASVFAGASRLALTRAHALGWSLLLVMSSIYFLALIVSARRPQPEAFFNWWVEGMLFLPAIAAVF